MSVHRRIDHLRIAFDEADRFRSRAETVGIIAIIAEPGEPALPVWREQPKRIPAFRAPGVGDLTALEHHMVDCALGEASAHGEPGVARADDDGCNRANRRCSELFSAALPPPEPPRASAFALR